MGKSNWERITADRPGWRLPKIPGVYAIYGDGQLLYVGSAGNLRSRFASHLIIYDPTRYRFYLRGESFFVLQIKYRRCRRFGEWLMREARLIRRLRPWCNRVGVRPLEVANAQKN